MPNADDYLATIGNVSVVNWDGVQKMIWNIVTLGKGSDNPAADFKKGKEQTTKVVDESIPSKEEKPATTAKEETTAQPVDDEQVTHDTKDEL